LDQLDDTTRVYEPITVQEQERLISEICDAYLDENGKIKPGKITEFHQAEQKLGFRILRNAWWGVSDTCFCLQIDLLFSNFPQTLTEFSPPLLSQYKPLGTQMQVHMSAPPCWMHHLVIGLWAKHIMKSIVFLYKSTLQRDDLRKPSGERLISNAAVDRVCDRLGQRLTCFTADDAGLKITPKYAKHLFNVSVNDKGTFTAGRVEILIVAYQFVLRDLIYNEVLHINEKIDAAAEGDPLHGIDHVVDPSTDIIRVVNSFADVFTLGRRYDTCADTLPVLAEKIKLLQDTLLEVMPGKSGEDIILCSILHNIVQYCIQDCIIYSLLHKCFL
jgi:hypothetical protein